MHATSISYWTASFLGDEHPMMQLCLPPALPRVPNFTWSQMIMLYEITRDLVPGVSNVWGSQITVTPDGPALTIDNMDAWS